MSNKITSSVGIIGCGWLGSALALALQDQGIEVLATRSNAENVGQLNSQGINAEVLLLPAKQACLNKHIVFKQHCLVIAITPQFRQGRVDYAEKVQQLVTAAQASNTVKQIILLSSTAIYNGLSGLVDEDSSLDLSADKVLLLNQAEQAVLSFYGRDTNGHGFKPADEQHKRSAYVLRLSGLVGPMRHPGKFLLKDRLLKSPQAIVNLIHQQDAVGLIQALLRQNFPRGICSLDIFNGVSPTQVSKKQYYQAAAKALNLPAPHFEAHDVCSNSSPKIVSGKKTQAILHYDFVYGDLLHWLDQGK